MDILWVLHAWQSMYKYQKNTLNHTICNSQFKYFFDRLHFLFLKITIKKHVSVNLERILFIII